MSPPSSPFGQRPDLPPHPHLGRSPALQIAKFITIGFLFSFLLLALHRRACTPSRRAARQSRRERKQKRRALRRAFKKHGITGFLSRISGNQSDSEDDDYEEKRQRLLSDAEDGVSTTMTEDIEQMRNAAEVFGDVASAPSSQSVARRISITSIAATETRPLMQGFELRSQAGAGEALTAYEDIDGSEDGSMVADGFRYTPGSSDYSPGHSHSSSVSDILGPDTKN